MGDWIAMIKKKTRDTLHEVFKHEAYDFTAWLQDNLDVFNECIDLTIINADREISAGSFSVNLVAEESGNKVIIENQLEKSNQDHLGKLITCLVAMEAKIAIWIVSEPRPEHDSAITWLNASFLSRFLPSKTWNYQNRWLRSCLLLTLIVGPSEETKAIGIQKENFPNAIIQSDMNSGPNSLNMLKVKHSSRHNLPSTDNWISADAGKTGMSFNYVV